MGSHFLWLQNGCKNYAFTLFKNLKLDIMEDEIGEREKLNTGAGADLFPKAEEGFKSRMFLKLISYNTYPNLIKKHRFG